MTWICHSFISKFLKLLISIFAFLFHNIHDSNYIFLRTYFLCSSIHWLKLMHMFLFWGMLFKSMNGRHTFSLQSTCLLFLSLLSFFSFVFSFLHATFHTLSFWHSYGTCTLQCHLFRWVFSEAPDLLYLLCALLAFLIFTFIFLQISTSAAVWLPRLVNPPIYTVL